MTASDKPSVEAADQDTAPKTRATKPRARAVRPPAKRVKRASKPTRQGKIAPRGTKTAKILALLRRPRGASLKELRKVTGWQAHSVRGFLSGALKKKMGLRVDSAQREDGERAYKLCGAPHKE